MLNIRQLEIFWAVMRTGSMVNAAKLLGISQPAISKFLRHTEDQIGMRLFERTNGRLQPTAEAEQLFPAVDTIFEDVEAVRRTTRDLRDSQLGRIKIAAIPTLAAELLPAPLGAFLRDRPQVDVGLKVLPTRQVIEKVVHQQVNIGILYGPVSDTSLTVLDLCITEIVAVLRRGHPLAAKAQITPEDLTGERLISVNPASPWGLLIEDAFAACGVARHSMVECNHSLISYSLVEAGVGVAVVEPLMSSEQRVQNVVVRPFRPRLEIRPQVIYSNARPLSRLHGSFIEELAASVRRLPFVKPIVALPQRRGEGRMQAHPGASGDPVAGIRRGKRRAV